MLQNDFAAGKLIALFAYADLRQSRMSFRSVGNLAIRTWILEPANTVVVVIGRDNDDTDDEDDNDNAAQHIADGGGKTSRRRTDATTTKK